LSCLLYVLLVTKLFMLSLPIFSCILESVLKSKEDQLGEWKVLA